MSQEKYGGIATSEQLEQLVQETNALIDDRHLRDVRLREIPTEVQQQFLVQAEHRTLGEPPGGYSLTLKKYPNTVHWPKTPQNNLIDGHDALVQIRFDGNFADPDRSFVRVLYGVANTAPDGAEPNYVARRDLINHYKYSIRTIDVSGKDPDEPLTDDGLTLEGLLRALNTLDRNPGFSEVDFADALKVGHTGESLTSEEVAKIEVERAEKDLIASMDREIGVLDVSEEEAVALIGMIRHLKQLPVDAPEFSGRPLPPKM